MAKKEKSKERDVQKAALCMVEVFMNDPFVQSQSAQIMRKFKDFSKVKPECYVREWLEHFIPVVLREMQCGEEDLIARLPLGKNEIVSINARGQIEHADLQAVHEVYWPLNTWAIEGACFAQETAVMALADWYHYQRRYQGIGACLYKVFYVNAKKNIPIQAFGTVCISANIGIGPAYVAPAEW